jgi:hypothetical protein
MTQVAVGKEIWKTGIQEICMVCRSLAWLPGLFSFALSERIQPGNWVVTFATPHDPP